MNSDPELNIAIIGGGAAGFFAAIAAKENHPGSKVIIFEKSGRLLAKVKVSGGGRCNVTNGCDSISELCQAYPRGGKALKKAFYRFSNKDTIRWFETRSVPLAVQDDLRVFPESGDSQSIIDCLLKEAQRLGIMIQTGMPVREIRAEGEKLAIIFAGDENPARLFDRVIVAAGGSPLRRGLDWLEKMGHKIEDPVPSLFTFNMPGEKIKDLMGVSATKALAKIQGTKFLAEGPLLITHWGMSGPAILKLSSFGARELSRMEYKFKLQVNWACEQNNEIVLAYLQEMASTHPQKMLVNLRPHDLPLRLWQYLLQKADLAENKPWAATGRKGLNKLVNILTNDVYEVDGRTTFRDEFVTCGGVSLESVDINTMQSKVVKNLYFAGEVLDIDGITGGFNLQAAWTTGWIAGISC